MIYIKLFALCSVFFIGAINIKAGDGRECSSEASAKKAKTELSQKTCPVMGGKINKKLFVDVKGKRIYVCCRGCIPKIKENPDKYIKKLQAKGVKLENAPDKREHKKE